MQARWHRSRRKTRKRGAGGGGKAGTGDTEAKGKASFKKERMGSRCHFGASERGFSGGT